MAIAIDDSWARDTGPVGVVGADGERALVDFVFNGWGGKYAPWADDDQLAARLAPAAAELVSQECLLEEHPVMGFAASLAMPAQGLERLVQNVEGENRVRM